jgi:hypothetical protein
MPENTPEADESAPEMCAPNSKEVIELVTER